MQIQDSKFNIQKSRFKIQKPGRRGKLYVDTGFKGDAEGTTKTLAWKDCPECFGRGMIGEAIVKVRKMFSKGKLKPVNVEKEAQPCRCIRTTELNIAWIVL